MYYRNDPSEYSLDQSGVPTSLYILANTAQAIVGCLCGQLLKIFMTLWSFW